MKINLNPFADHALKDESWAQVAKEYYKTNLMRKELAKREIFLKEKLQVLSDHKSARANEYAFSKIERTGPVDYKAIVEEQLPGLNIEPYRKDTIFMWKITKV